MATLTSILEIRVKSVSCPERTTLGQRLRNFKKAVSFEVCLIFMIQVEKKWDFWGIHTLMKYIGDQESKG